MKTDDDYVMSRLPPRLVERLMPFQKEGVQFAVKKHGRCLIADEMGLGKTLQAISVACYYQAEWPLLIIVPSSLRYCWIEELEKWLPGVHPHNINLIRGGNDASDISSAQITIVTYGLLSKQTSGIVREALTNQHFKVIICDESHYIRNSRTASSKAVVPLIQNACRRVLLSGTPALSKPVELFPQIDAIKPGGFGSWWQFTARYCDARMEWVGRQKMRKVDGASHLEELQSRLSSSLMIRREKKDVLKQLPPKQRQKVLFELKDSSQKKEILNLFEDLKPMLKKGSTSASLNLEAATEVTDDKNKESLHRLSIISKLYQLSGEAKIGPVKEYLEMLCDNKSLKFLVFAYHHVMMNGIQQTLWEKKVKFIRIDGDTKPEDRLLHVQQFQSDSETRVAILSILAAGVGLTFTAAKLVVFAEMYWTPGVMLQCEDRAHRIGQTASLPVHYLVAKGTMDEWVWGAVCRKTIVTSTALSGEGRQLEADHGDRYQVDVLSNADAWVPTEQTDMDLQTFFQSQKSNDQRSILEFFTPPSSRHKGQKKSESSGQKRQREEADGKSECKKQKTSSRGNTAGRLLEEVVILDSEEEGEEFKEEKKQKKRTKKTNSAIAKEDSSPSPDYELDAPDWNTVSTPISQNKIVGSEDTSETKMMCVTPTSSLGSLGRLQVSSNNQRKANRTSGKKDCSSDEADVAPVGSIEDSHWSCSACTFLNHTELPRCEMCDTPSKHRRHRAASSKSSRTRELGSLKLASYDRVETTHDNGNVEDNQISNGLKGNESQSTDLCKQLNCQEQLKLTNGHKLIETWDTSQKSPVFAKPKKSIILGTVKESDGPEACTSFTRDSTEILQNQSGLQDCDNSSPTRSSQQSININESVDILGMCLGEAKDDRVVKSSSNSRKRKSFLFGADEEEDFDDDSVTCTKTSKVPGHQISEESFKESNSVQAADDQNHLGADEVDGFNSDDDLLTSSLGTPSSKKRKCFQLESDDDDLPKDPGNRSLVKEDAASETKTPIRTEKSSPCDAPPTWMSTPADQDTRCASSSWELLPCDSPCFNLELESSGDRSHEKDTTFDQNNFPVFDHSKQYLSASSITKLNTSEKSSLVSESSIVCQESFLDDDEELPVLALPKRRSGSKSEKTPSKEKESPTSSGVPACAKPLFKRTPNSDSRKKSSKSDDASKIKAISTRRETGQEADEVSFAQSDQTASGSKQPKHTPGKRKSPNVPASSQTAFPSFLYCVSLYTGRVYLFDQNGEALNENFLPLDVEMGNVDQLPLVLHHQGNMRLVQKFVREWNSLTETKKRLIVKRGMVFSSPLVAYEEVRSGKVISTQRHRTKEDVATEAVKMAETMKGSVRMIARKGQTGSEGSQGQSQHTQDGRGVLQAVTSDGVPLCLNCQHPYQNPLLQKSTITDTDNAWSTRFCSTQCMDKYWMQTHSSYNRDKVYEVEHGVCQMCKFDAHTFYKQIRDTPDLGKRAKLLSESKFSSLKSKQKETMVRKPVEGQFWHVDHILPVWEGGGMCDIDNMRTLCVMCHHKVTATQARKRAVVRRLQGAAAGADITAFFKKS